MPKRVLIIDDEVVILEVLQGCLEELGDMEVLLANCGLDGLKVAQLESPDGILLDVSMPSMDGLEVLRQLQLDPNTRSIPVILLTAKVQPEDRSRFAMSSAIGVILKPFDPLTLAAQVATLFGWVE
jgi:CheY-like chemotaxis protein